MKNLIVILAALATCIFLTSCDKQESITPEDTRARPNVHYVDGYHGAILGNGYQLTDTIEWHKISRVTVNGIDLVYDTYIVQKDNLVNQAIQKAQKRMQNDIRRATGKARKVEADVHTFSPNGFITLVGLWFCNQYFEDETFTIEFEVQLYVRGTSNWANQVYTYTAMIDNSVPECNSVWFESRGSIHPGVVVVGKHK